MILFFFLPALAALGPILSGATAAGTAAAPAAAGAGLGAAGAGALGGAAGGALGGASLGSALGGLAAGAAGAAPAAGTASTAAIPASVAASAPAAAAGGATGATGATTTAAGALGGLGGQAGGGTLGSFLGGVKSALGLGGGEIAGLSGEAISPELASALMTPELGLESGVTLVPMGEGAVGQITAAAPSGAVQVGPELAAASGLPTGGVGLGTGAKLAARGYNVYSSTQREDEPPPPVVVRPEKKRFEPVQPTVNMADLLARIKARGQRPTGVIGIGSL